MSGAGATAGPVRLRARDLDGRRALVLAGSNRGTDVEGGPYDALRGLVLLSDVHGWRPVPAPASGLRLPGDVRGLVWVETAADPLLVAASSNGRLQAFRLVTRPALPSAE